MQEQFHTFVLNSNVFETIKNKFIKSRCCVILCFKLEFTFKFVTISIISFMPEGIFHLKSYIQLCLPTKVVDQTDGYANADTYQQCNHIISTSFHAS